MKKKIIIMSILIVFALLIANSSCAGYQEWNSLNYDVTLNQYGDAEIVETWDVDIDETNTLFKQFDMENTSGYITDVKVSRQENGIENPLTEIYEQQYHVDSGCYYGMMIEDNTFEIAWNVGLDDSFDRRTYKIYYTVKDVVNVYDDCSEFYWQFLGQKNEMEGSNITGTIHLPSSVSDIEKLHIWGHGSLNGDVERTSVDRLDFKMDRISSNEMLEIRVVSEEDLFELAYNRFDFPKFNEILEEENKWVEEANAKRKQAQTFLIILTIITVVICIVFLTKIIKYIKAGKQLKQKYPKSELKYFRDIPDEKNATPARTIHLCYLATAIASSDMHMANIFSATILDLTLKKYISLEPIGKDNVKINLLSSENRAELTRDEEIIYNLIIENSDRDTNSVDTKTLEKYANKHYQKFYKLMQEVSKSAKDYYNSKEIIDKEKKVESQLWTNKGLIYLFSVVFVSFTLPFYMVTLPIVIELLICCILCFMNSGKVIVLKPEAYEEQSRWFGLKKYMTDFSLLKEKEVPDLILWEKFLVYATTFGISKKVLEELVKVYPEMTSEEFYMNRNYTYLYLASHSSGLDSLGNLNKSFCDVCNAAVSHYSSASGSGGGFSGGGGGRRWRSEAVVVDKIL